MEQLRSFVALHMCITRSSLGHRLLCEAHLAPPIKRQELMLRHGCGHYVRQERRENPCISMKIPEVAWILLQLLRQPGENCSGCCVSQERLCVVMLCYVFCYGCCATLEENKRVCSYYHFFMSSSSLLARANSADSVNSKRTDHTTEWRAIQPPSHPSTSSHPSELSQSTGFPAPCIIWQIPTMYLCYIW